MSWPIKKILRAKSSRAQAPLRTAARKVRPVVELLEDRTVMSGNVLITFDANQFFAQDVLVVDFTVQGQHEQFGVGLLPITLSNPDGSNPQPEFESLCVDALNGLQQGKTSFLATPTPTATALGAPAGGEIAYLYNHFGYFTYPHPYTAAYPLAEAAGLQIAVWELEYGLTDADFHFDPGFEAFGSTPAVFNAALGYADSFVAQALGKNETANFLDVTLGGTVNNPPGQSLLAPTPTITTQIGGNVVVGSGVKVVDSATLSGGLNPTGSVAFNLYAASDVNQTTPLDTETVVVAGDGTYTTPTGYLPTAAGTYYWVATYGGDAFNLAVASGTKDEPVVVGPATPKIVTNTSPASGVLGAVTLKDSATLSGGFHETGTITFKLVAPDGVTVVDTETANVTGNGTYVTPTGYVPTGVGTFNWVAVYSGDANNAMISSHLGDEPATVMLPPDQISKRLFLSGAPAPVVVAAPIVLAAVLIDGSPAGPTTDSMPTFSWTAVGGAARYDLWVDDITTGQSQVVRNQNVTTTSFTSPANLLVGHSYNWWVRALSAAGTAGPWSQALSFNVILLTAPSLTGTTGEITNALPTFAWSTVVGANHYDLWVDDLTSGTSQVIRNQSLLSSPFTTVTPLAVGHSYQWWVRAVTNRGTPGLWSQGSSFTEVVVGTPAPIGPKANVGAGATFTWVAGIGADHYDVWVNDVTTGQSQALRNQSVIGTSWQPPSLLKIGDSYRWWVRALSSTGASGAWSAAVDFNVVAFPPPSLLTAGGSAARPSFTWTTVVNADHYDLWVDDITTGQSQAVRAMHVIGTSWTSAPLTQGHSYRWWVRAFDSSGKASLWSDFSTFTIT